MKRNELERVSTAVVLYWHQGNGDLSKRIESLNRAVRMARLKAQFVQRNGVAGWRGRDAELAREFRQKIDCACIQGWLEREVAGVAPVQFFVMW